MKPPFIITVGGGKGGIGKSTVITNIAASLSQKGCSVGLIDADLGGANLHICLGMRRPSVHLVDFVSGAAKTLSETALPTQIPNTWLISGSNESFDSANLKFSQKQRLIAHINKLEAQYILIDLGAGSDNQVVDFFAAFPFGIVISDSLPTSIENAYGFLKNGIIRGLLRLYPADRELGDLVRRFSAPKQEGNFATVDEMMGAIGRTFPAQARSMKEWLHGRKLFLVLNMVKDRDDIITGKRFCELVRKYLGVGLVYIGYVAYSPDVRASIRAMKPLVLADKPSPVRECFSAIADNLMALTKGRA